MGCTEHHANCRVAQTNSVASSTKRTKSENEAAARESEVVRRRAINPTSCRRRAFKKRRRKATIYKTGDLVAIERTQGGLGLKLHSKFLGPYRVVFFSTLAQIIPINASFSVLFQSWLSPHL